MGVGFRSGKPKMAGDKVFTSEARAQLGLLIAERDTQRAEIAAKAQAKATAEARADNCRQALARAHAAVEQAKRDAVSALMEGRPSAHDGVKLAREAALTAQDALDVAESVCARLAENDRESPAVLGPDYKDQKVREAAKQVFSEHPAVATLLPKLLAAEAEYLRQAATFRWFVNVGAIKIERIISDDSATGNLRAAHARTDVSAGWPIFDEVTPVPIGSAMPGNEAGRRRIYAYQLMEHLNKPLDAAVAALMADASAPLPEMPTP